MKKYIAILCAVVMISTFAGCRKTTYPDLSSDAAAFEMGKFFDKNHNVEYGALEFEGRIYIGYGVLGGSLHKTDIEKCVGYIVMDEASSSAVDLNDKSVRIYTLTGDAEHNYLMDCDTATSLMNQPSFWRAVDTQGADIPNPDYIKPLEYSFWN